MNKEEKAKFKKRFINQTKRKTASDQMDVVSGILDCKSFDEYRGVIFNAGRYSNRKDLIRLPIFYDTPFTLEDREFIIWTGFIALFKEETKFRANQRMSLEVFDNEYYSFYLDAVLTEHSEPDPMYKYRENKRKELMAADRQHTIKQIRRFELD